VVQRLGGIKQHREQEDHRLVADGPVDPHNLLIVKQCVSGTEQDLLCRVLVPRGCQARQPG
jgi:hypothetical protein